MALRPSPLALVAFALALVVSPSTFAQPEERIPATQDEAALEEARANLSPDERELLEVREEMRKLRLERRDAMQRARDSGDPQAIERVVEEFRPRMDAIREKVRASRELVMETRLREHPELAARLEASAESGDRFQCGAGPGHASDEARRRAFRRLQALSPNGSLTDPADIPTPVRTELQTHARRVALLQCIRERARLKNDTESVERARVVFRAEQQRHDRALRELFGAPPVPTGGRAGGEPAAGHATKAAAPAGSAEESER